MRRATSVIRNHRVREKSTCRLKLLLEHSCYLNCVKLNLFCQSGQLTGPPNTIEQGVLWVGVFNTFKFHDKLGWYCSWTIYDKIQQHLLCLHQITAAQLCSHRPHPCLIWYVQSYVSKIQLRHPFPHVHFGFRRFSSQTTL